MVSHAESIRRPLENEALGDPLARVLALDEGAQHRFRVSLVLTVLLYVALGVRGLLLSTGLGSFADSVRRVLTRAHHAEHQIEQPPPPPPPPEPPPPQPEAPKEAPPPKAAPAAPPPAA